MDDAQVNTTGTLLPITTQLDNSGDDNLTKRVTNFLLGRVSLDEFCQFGVLDLLVPLNPWQMSIYSMGSDTLLQLRGSFGQTADHGNLHQYSCLSDIKVGELLRNGTPLANFSIGTTDFDNQLTFAELGDGPQVLWPLTTSHSLAGIVQVRFNEIPDISLLARLMTQIVPPITLTIDLSGHPNVLIPGDHHNGNSAVKSLRTADAVSPFTRNGAETLRNHTSTSTEQSLLPEDDPPALTHRQHRVLELMADGMTNGQIARALAFSESTIRQETMAIYRALDVSGRVDAVKVAGEQRLLSTLH